MRKPILAGNWKMYKTPKEAAAFARELAGRVGGLTDREVVVCPPHPCVAPVAEALAGSTIGVGAQDAHWEEEGAFTGNVSVPMLKEAGARFVIVGHSERRRYEKEDDAVVNRKLRAVLRHGLTAIVCVGEVLSEREAGSTERVVEAQLKGCFEGIPPSDLAGVVVAYEPVWAIGTGHTATPEQAQEVHRFIRGWIAGRYGLGIAEALRIQYGGSVKPDNIRALMAQPDVDGALVGGASLKVDSFEAIVKF